MGLPEGGGTRCLTNPALVQSHFLSRELCEVLAGLLRENPSQDPTEANSAGHSSCRPEASSQRVALTSCLSSSLEQFHMPHLICPAWNAFSPPACHLRSSHPSGSSSRTCGWSVCPSMHQPCFSTMRTCIYVPGVAGVEEGAQVGSGWFSLSFLSCVTGQVTSLSLFSHL